MKAERTTTFQTMIADSDKNGEPVQLWVGSEMEWTGDATVLQDVNGDDEMLQEVAIRRGDKARVTHSVLLPTSDYLLFLELLSGPDKGAVFPVRYPNTLEFKWTSK